MYDVPNKREIDCVSQRQQTSSFQKEALQKRYNLTEEGYRRKFRNSKPDETENPMEFVVRITKYLEKWTELAKATDHEKLKILFVKEQFLNMCNQPLAVYLNESPFEDMKEMCARAERYLQAHSEKLTNDRQRISEETKAAECNANIEERLLNTESRQLKDCYNCGKLGHIRAECRNQGGGKEQLCSKCRRYGHIAETCRTRSEYGGMMRTRRWINRKEKPHQRITPNTSTRVKQHEEQETTDSQNRLKPIKGIINGHMVETLRDSGCSTICVDKKLVQPNQLTGRYQTCRLMDGTERRFEIARVNLNTPYIKQEGVLVLCVKDLEFGIVVGDVPGALCKCKPNPNWNFEHP